MGFEVLITDEAFGDLDAITGFIKQNTSLECGHALITDTDPF